MAELAAAVPARAWRRMRAGQGSQGGPRLYDWAWVRLPYVDVAPGRAQWLLGPPSLPDRQHQQPAAAPEVKYFRAYGPEATPLEELVRVVGRCWTIEGAFEQAKGEVGLDEYEVRRYDAWMRHITLALLAHAALAVACCCRSPALPHTAHREKGKA